MTSDITRESVFLSAKGGSLDFVLEGEIIASVAVPAGRVSAAEYVDLLPFGAELHVADGLAVVQPRRLGGRQPYGDGSHDSGANPDYRPTSSTRLEMEMRLTLRQMQAQAKRIEARERALQSIERVPSAPPAAPAPAPADDVPVIE